MFYWYCRRNSFCAALRSLHKADYLFLGMTDLALLSRRVCDFICVFFIVLCFTRCHANLSLINKLAGCTGSFVLKIQKTEEGKKKYRAKKINCKLYIFAILQAHSNMPVRSVFIYIYEMDRGSCDGHGTLDGSTIPWLEDARGNY